ncbi:hypothetical protein RQP46_002626 [Phenoliferia psychrophenolica]
MVSINDLPVEVLSKILELAHDPRHPSTTYSACLVSRTWRDPAQRVLFDAVGLAHTYWHGTGSVADKWGAAWESYAVNRLYTPRFVEIHGGGATSRGAQPLASGARELRWVGGVRHLRLTGIIGSSSFVEDRNLKDLERLDVAGDCILLGHLQDDVRSSTALSVLRFLSVDSHTFFRTFLMDYAAHTHLTTLDLHISSVQKTLDEILPLLPNFPPTLRRISLTTPAATLPSAASSLDAIILALPSLTHLTLQFKVAYKNLTEPSPSSLALAPNASYPSITHLSLEGGRGPIAVPLDRVLDLVAETCVPDSKDPGINIQCGSWPEARANAQAKVA